MVAIISNHNGNDYFSLEQGYHMKGELWLSERERCQHLDKSALVKFIKGNWVHNTGAWVNTKITI